MKAKEKRNLSRLTKNTIILISILIALGYVAIDVFIHAVFINHTSFWNELTGAALHDMVTRLIGAVFIFVPGIITAYAYSGQKKAEEITKRSEQLYRSLFENMLNGFAYCKMLFEQGKPSDFIYLDVNSAFENLTGLKNVTGKKVSEVIPGIHESDPQMLELYGRVALTGVPEKYEGYIQAMDLWFSIAVYSPEKEYFVAVFDVITERKKADIILRKSEQKYKTLVENIPQKIFYKDTNLVYVSCNENYARDLKIQADAITGKTDYDFFPKDIAEKYRTDDKRIMDSGHGAEIEESYILNGAEVTVNTIKMPVKDVSGNIIGIIGIFWDITERKQIEKALKQSEERLLAAQGVALIGSWETDIMSSKVIWSEETYRIFELNRDSFHQSHPSFLEFVHPDDRAKVNSAFEKSFDTRVPNSIEHRIVTPSGIVKYVEEHWQIIHDDQGRPIRAVGTCQDITERKKLQEQLMAQDRLVSIGQLVAGVAHEINNPLTSVVGFSELLLQRDLPDDVRSDLKIVSDEAQRAATIVKGLLTFSRKQTEGKEPIDINIPVQIVMKLNAHRFAVNNIQVNTHLAEGLPQITGNASQLQQVFFNIVMNAEQIMLEAHGKGVITITTKQVGNMVRVSFADDGPGISLENMKKLFTPFFTTKEVGKGTGLGLSICHGIITDHGGKIYAESELGKGATFIVELPVQRATAAKEVA